MYILRNMILNLTSPHSEDGICIISKYLFDSMSPHISTIYIFNKFSAKLRPQSTDRYNWSKLICFMFSLRDYNPERMNGGWSVSANKDVDSGGPNEVQIVEIPIYLI